MSSTVASTGSSQVTKSMLQTLQLSECARTKRCPVPYITSPPPACGLRDGVLPLKPEQTCSWTESGLKFDSGSWRCLLLAQWSPCSGLLAQPAGLPLGSPSHKEGEGDEGHLGQTGQEADSHVIHMQIAQKFSLNSFTQSLLTHEQIVFVYFTLDMAVGFGRETRDLCLLFLSLSSTPGCPYVLRCCFYAGNALPLIPNQTSDCFPASPFKGLPGTQTSVSKLLTLPPLPTLTTLAKILPIPVTKCNPAFIAVSSPSLPAFINHQVLFI